MNSLTPLGAYIAFLIYMATLTLIGAVIWIKVKNRRK